MSPLRATQCFMKALLDRAERPRPPNSAVPKVSLHVEQLEHRDAPGSLGGFSEFLGGSGWGDDGSVGWSDVFNPAGYSVQPNSSSNGPILAPTTPGNKSVPQPARVGNEAQSTAQGQSAAPQQTLGAGTIAAAGSGQELASLASSPDAGAPQSSSQVNPLITVVVNIATPKAGAQVPGGGTFSTFGTVSPTNATMSAWVTDSNNTVYNGTAITPLPPYNWGFKFTGIPTGSPVSLTVQGVYSGNTGSQTITITPT